MQEKLNDVLQEEYSKNIIRHIIVVYNYLTHLDYKDYVIHCKNANDKIRKERQEEMMKDISLNENNGWKCNYSYKFDIPILEKYAFDFIKMLKEEAEW